MADKEKPEAEEEYESDLDDAPLPAVRRRAAASDDEGAEEDAGGSPMRPRKAGSDADSDGQGAPEVYDEGAYEDGEEEYEEYVEAYEEFEEGGGGERRVAAEAVIEAGDREGKAGDGDAEEVDEAAAGEEEKKGNEPYAVPTTGAFYMHDDRFQEARGRGRGRGRQRRMVNNRKLWNPKEEQAWAHDRFDDMNLHDFHGDSAKRKQGGRFRGRGGGPAGRTRGISRGNFRGNRSRAYYHDGSKDYSYVRKESHVYHDNFKNARHASYDNGKNRVPKLSHAQYDDVSNYDTVPKQSRTYYNDAKSQKNAPRVVRGKGSKRYQPRSRSTTEISSVPKNKSQNEDMSSNANFGKHHLQTSNSRLEQVLPVKQTVTSNLNLASPPFYPSRSSNQELPVSQVGSGQPSSTSRPFSSSIGMEHVSPTPQYGNLLRGKPFVPSVGRVEAGIKGINNPALQSSASSPKGQFPVAANQITRDYVRPTLPIVQPSSVQSSTQSAPRLPGPMFGAQFCGSTKILAGTEIPSSGSNNLNTQLKVKGQPGDKGEERASFLYGGTHILGATGAMGLTLGDQGFHGTPALLPVMQFGGQRPGGPGAPSIGIALPGFVSQQQLGLSNSEMAWLPMLTGASGAPYGSPYIAVDGSYYSRPSEQASSSVSFREPSGSNASSLLKSQEMTEVVSDELSQRQNKPRRYSEMNFGQ